jgi:hypothetical protein
MEMKLRLRDVIGFFTNYLVINKKTAKKKKSEFNGAEWLQ